MHPNFLSHLTRIRFVTVALCYWLAFHPPFLVMSKPVNSGTSETDATSRSTSAPPINETRFLAPSSNSQSLGIVLTSVNGSFNGHVGIGYHQPTNKVITSAFYASSGQPNNFELIASDGTHAEFSNVAGIPGELRIETARDDGQGMSLGGFTPGEVLVGISAPGVIARIAADGSSIQNPWVVLPD